MITIQYRCKRTEMLHTEECGSDEHAYQLMKHVNLDDSLKGVSVIGAKRYFCGAGGTFYRDTSGKAAQPIGREKRLDV